jgi:AcrR family transcriptional regulator
VKISRGNFYYHFKSKDQILDAVIKQHLANTRKMLAMWESEGRRKLLSAKDLLRPFSGVMSPIQQIK